MLPSYPKIYNIGHKAILDLFKEVVLVEEKVDGSQFSFCRTPEGMVFRSRGAEIFVESPPKMFAEGVNQIMAIADQLVEGWVYRGEYLSKPKHNALAYDRVPKRNFILFDVTVGPEIFLGREAKLAEAERLGLEVVPLMFQGRVQNPEQLLSFLNYDSVLGGVKVEGVVVKNYNRFTIDGKAMMGKFVSEAFKEVHRKEWKSPVSYKDAVQGIIAALRNEQRWAKAYQRLRDLGQLEHTPRDIGNLINAVKADITEEEADWIKDKLFNWAIKNVLRGATSGIPEWYKKMLLERSFASEGEINDEVQ